MSKSNVNVMNVFTAAVLCGLLTAGCSSESKKTRCTSRADAYFETGDYERATIEYINVLRIDNKDGHAFRQLAQSYWERSMYREAFPALIAAKDANPNDVSIRLKLGDLYLVSGLHEKARDEALAALESEPDNVDALARLVDSSVGTNQLAEAMARLQAGRDALADQAPYHIVVGMIHLRQNEFDSAEKAFREGETIDPKSSDVHQALAVLHRARRDPERAAEEFERSGRLAPVASAARVRWAVSELGQGDVAAAKEILQEIVAKNTDYAAARLKLAQIAYSEKDYAGCQAHLARIPTQSPQHMAKLLLQAGVMLAQGKVDDAVKELERMARKFPQTPRVHHALGLACMRQGNAKRAIQAFEQTTTLAPGHIGATLLLAGLQIQTGNPEPAVASMEALVRKAPRFDRALVLLAAGYRAMGQHDEAAATCRKLVELRPDDPATYYQLGLALVGGGKTLEARQAFVGALKAEPGYLRAIEQLVRLDLADDKSDNALKRIEDALALRQDDVSLLLLKGTVHQVRKSFELAEAAYLKAIESKPDFLRPYTALCRLYVSQQKDEEALAKVEHALSLNPEDIGSMLLAATLYERQNKEPKAIALYEKLVKRLPNFAEAANNLACLYMGQQGGMDRALEHAKAARKAAPENPYVADTLGWIAYQCGDHKWALSLLREAVGKTPDHPEILYHYGVALCAVGEESDGLATIEKALTLDPAFPNAEDARALIDILRIDPATVINQETLDKLAETLEKKPTHVTALYRTGAICENTGKLDEGLKYYRKTIAVSPEFAPAAKGAARLLLEQKGDAQEALAMAKRARDLVPDDAETDLLLAEALQQTGEHEWSLSLLQKSARNSPKNAEIRYRLAWAHYICGDVPQSIKEARAVLSMTGQVATAQQFVDLVALHTTAASLEAVPPQVREALDRDKDYLPARMIEAAVDLSKGDNAKACAIYEKVLEQYPKFSPAAAKLASLYLDDPEKSDKAFELATAARRQLREDPVVARTLGILAYQRSDYRSAARLLAESMQKLPQDSESLYRLGLSQHKLRNQDAAKSTLGRALELDSESSFAEEARKIVLEIGFGRVSSDEVGELLDKYKNTP